MSLTEERTPPPSSKWDQVQIGTLGKNSSAWVQGKLLVISQLADVETNGIVGPTWVLSISRRGNRRPNNRELHKMLKGFRCPSPWDEDNHESGMARKVFIPVDPKHRTACECKTDEILVVEKDGYTWSKKRM